MLPTPKSSAALALLCLSVATPPASADRACIFEPENTDSCSRFVGCINTDGTHFYGSARGWETGVLFAVTSTGETCTGTWSFQPILEKGEGKMTCSNGEEGRLTFFSRDTTVNAISGIALTNQSNRMQMWASSDLPTYLAGRFADVPQPGFQCGTVQIPLPDNFPDIPTE